MHVPLPSHSSLRRAAPLRILTTIRRSVYTRGIATVAPAATSRQAAHQKLPRSLSCVVGSSVSDTPACLLRSDRRATRRNAGSGATGSERARPPRRPRTTSHGSREATVRCGEQSGCGCTCGAECVIPPLSVRCSVASLLRAASWSARSQRQGTVSDVLSRSAGCCFEHSLRLAQLHSRIASHSAAYFPCPPPRDGPLQFHDGLLHQ
jgi:hypothetical protein